MKTATLEQFTKDPDAYIESSDNERVLLTREGKPLAWVVSAEQYDEEDLQYMASAEFWRMIEQRRREPTISLEEVRISLLEASDDAESTR